jgi:hypothetical protein
MPATRRGIYHNLRESEYVVSNQEITFHFSSELYLKKFLIGYKGSRIKFKKKFSNIINVDFNTDTIADVLFYQEVEKRGFHVRIGRAGVNFNDVYKYALRKMTDRQSPLWVRIIGEQEAEKKESN